MAPWKILAFLTLANVAASAAVPPLGDDPWACCGCQRIPKGGAAPDKGFFWGDSWQHGVSEFHPVSKGSSAANHQCCTEDGWFCLQIPPIWRPVPISDATAWNANLTKYFPNLQYPEYTTAGTYYMDASHDGKMADKNAFDADRQSRPAPGMCPAACPVNTAGVCQFLGKDSKSSPSAGIAGNCCPGLTMCLLGKPPPPHGNCAKDFPSMGNDINMLQCEGGYLQPPSSIKSQEYLFGSEDAAKALVDLTEKAFPSAEMAEIMSKGIEALLAISSVELPGLGLVVPVLQMLGVFGEGPDLGEIVKELEAWTKSLVTKAVGDLETRLLQEKLAGAYTFIHTMAGLSKTDIQHHLSQAQGLSDFIEGNTASVLGLNYDAATTNLEPETQLNLMQSVSVVGQWAMLGVSSRIMLFSFHTQLKMKDQLSGDLNLLMQSVKFWTASLHAVADLIETQRPKAWLLDNGHYQCSAAKPADPCAVRAYEGYDGASFIWRKTRGKLPASCLTQQDRNIAFGRSQCGMNLQAVYGRLMDRLVWQPVAYLGQMQTKYGKICEALKCDSVSSRIVV